ncbi:alpha-1,2-fucosyltransferase [Sphingobacterium sp. SGG-5]|uniref:alpha-1,2-fucosyltransferase n=1 Tax=Sphingobacterium sp. SGG-5 TaxID=2710881 RepID=UPI0013EA91E4|nr:alpha-1,2-fucosyltransferase [Sphingobacterium sp. SGG-5]NGM63270.1 alpha-1,2-fucosyltransferase [Sphingobacterium sp. SGG-5]
MKIVKFLGGLGNQMFQYAFYLALTKKGHKVKADLTDFEQYELHNGFELEDIFSFKLQRTTNFDRNLYLTHNRKWIWRKLRRIMGTKNAYWEENPKFQFNPHIFEEKRSKYYWGYWQHEDYLNLVEQELKEHLVFPPFVDEKNRQQEAVIINHPNTVAVHVRHGDYIGHPNFGGICTEDYYRQGITYMMKQTEDPLFVFFSNDINWCRQHFGDINAHFVDWNMGKDSFRDMQLMSLCKHFIIANSSFSWWGAWLSNHPQKIIVSPKRWKNTPESEVLGLISPTFITF